MKYYQTTLSIASLIIGILLASAANANSNNPSGQKIYLRADLGYNFFLTPSATTASFFNNSRINATNTHVANNIGYNLGLGYQLLPRVRSDITFTYRPSISYNLTDNAPEVGKATLNNYTVMLNGYYDFKVNPEFTPYVGAGIGASRNSTNFIYWPVAAQKESGRSITQLAWQVGAGFACPLTKRLLFDVSYQFIDLGSFKNTGVFNVGPPGAPTSWKTLYSNQVQAGVRYSLA